MYRSHPEITAKGLAKVGRMPTAVRHPPSANDPLTNWRCLLDQKPDKGPHETAIFWCLGSDSEQHEPLSDIIEQRVLPRLFFLQPRS